MKSKTINKWLQVVNNPPKIYKELFVAQKEFFKKNIPEGKLILDLGCGNGRIAKVLSKNSKKVFCIDNDEEAIEKAKKNLKDICNVEIILRDAENLFFNENQFDAVICIQVFQNFVTTKYKVLSEIKRILKKKGIFILSVYNENALNERLNVFKKYEYSKVKSIWDNGTIIFENGVVSEQFRKEEIIKILESAGFTIKEINKVSIFYLIKCIKK